MNVGALFFGVLIGAPLGLGMAFLLFGNLLNRSNNHGDSVGENSRYTGGIIFSSQEDKKLHKTDDQEAYITMHTKYLPQDPVFKNRDARVVRRMPQPEKPAVPAAAYAAPAAAATQTAAAGQGFPSSTAFPTAPAETPAPTAPVAQQAQADPFAQGFSIPDPTMQGFSAPAAPTAPTAQDYENCDNYIE